MPFQLQAATENLRIYSTFQISNLKAHKILWIVIESKGKAVYVGMLLPCDHEVMGSSPGNRLLQKYRERLRT
jgi:hypothetical protein